MKDITVGFAMCGSYCTFDTALETLETVCRAYKTVVPVMSESAYSTDSRFGRAENWNTRVRALCGTEIIHTITGAEPIGPKMLFDILVIAPCTGNTLAKLACGIADTCVTMAAKAHLRNARPLLIAVSSNDALSGNASNIGVLLARKNVYFVPFYQDDPVNKPTSLIADFGRLREAVDAALGGRQLQPLLCLEPANGDIKVADNV